MKDLSNLTTDDLLAIALEMNWAIYSKDGVPTVSALVDYDWYKKLVRISDDGTKTARDALLSAVGRASRVVWLDKSIQESPTFVEFIGE
jgi:hypothetical protein